MPETRTIRRFLITGDGRTAEAAQFSRGLVFIVWDGPEPRPEMWIDLEHLREERPSWDITWIDGETQ